MSNNGDQHSNGGGLQDCEIMRQSIEELFEAGFRELENLVAPPPARPMYHGGQAPPPVGVIGEGEMGNIQHGLGSMNLRPSEPMPTGFGPMSGSSFPRARYLPLALQHRTVSIALLSISKLRRLHTIPTM